MRRLAGAALAAAVLLLGLPSSALAEPSAGTCGTPDPRVVVPAGFGLDVCADSHRITLVNRQSRPVQVRMSGDVSRAKTRRADDGAAAAVLRAAFPEGQVLMPGDSAQWSFGAGTGLLEVSPDHGEAVTSTLAASLPGTQDRVSSTTAAFGALVRSGVSAMDSRTTCLAAGPNFLGGAACDLAAATTIGLALHTGFPAAVATQLAGVMLDLARWSAWSSAAAAADHALAGNQVLSIGVQPPKAPAPARAVAPRTAATAPTSHPAHPAVPHPSAAAAPRPATPRPPTAPPAARPLAAPPPPAAPGHGGTGWPIPWPLPWPLPLPHPPSGGHDGGHDHDSGHHHGHGHGDPHGR